MASNGCDFSSGRLQDLLLVANDDRKALYWRQVDEAGAPLPDADANTIRPRCRLRLDTFVNSFYERYWRELTSLATLKLVTETSGPCRIRMMRRVIGQADTILVDALSQGELERSTLAISLAMLSASDAVIYAEFEAFEDTAVLHGGAWLTDAAPKNEVRLAIVICSLGREAMLVDNLRRIAPIVANTEEISRLSIVRQGGLELAEFGPYTQLETTTSFADKLHLIRQENFGGTGGFVRGIIESLDADATHVVLLDDDVRIEPAVLERLTTLLSYLTNSTTIGGQMLDLHHPTLMHASHETVDFRSLQLCNPCKDIDMGIPNAVDLFGRRHVSDYNAWWLCCIPASVFQKIGLPMPMFIRHDDVEYGVRTIASDSPLVTMPGIFIWHAPFTSRKLTPSFFYYERRNFLITAATCRATNPFHLALLHWRDAWAGLRRHRYEYCWAVCRAADDFLAGPNVVFSNIRERHDRLAADHARFTLLTMTRLRQTRPSPCDISLTRAFLSRAKAGNRAEASFASMIRHLAFAILRTSLALLLRSRRVAASYRANGLAYTSPAFWRGLLAVPPRKGAPS